MREIKFRAKTATTNRWAYGHYAFTQGHHVIYEDGEPFIIVLSTLGQYTGLKDKGGFDIYEGDITTTDLSRPYLVVVFRNGSFMYQCHHDGEDYHDVMLFNKKDLDRDVYTEVIGNIYENPELLERGAE